MGIAVWAPLRSSDWQEEMDSGITQRPSATSVLLSWRSMGRTNGLAGQHLSQITRCHTQN